jgi:hypothetical protein
MVTVICFAEIYLGWNFTTSYDLDAGVKKFDLSSSHHDRGIVSDTILLASCDHRPSTIMLPGYDPAEVAWKDQNIRSRVFKCRISSLKSKLV